MSGNYRIYITIVLCLVAVGEVLGQAKVRKLPPNINHPSVNVYAPFISGDGQTVIYLSDYTDDGHHSMHTTTRKTISTWNDGVEVTKLVNRPTLNYRGGHSLNFEGDLLYFTSRKSGLGGFDLWQSQRSGNNWGVPKNLGSTINSRANEGAASISADGKYLYFMRCDQMTEYKGASGCKIMVSKMTNSGWGTPEELPAKINTGNSQTPRILADGKTLIFASNVMGGKGGMDLYLSRKEHDGWSEPVPMDFVNTEGQDQFASIDAKGRYLLIDRPGERDWQLIQVLIPDEFRPLRVMRVSGTVVDEVSGEPLNAKLTVFNIADRERLWNESIGNKGDFGIVLNEGAVYDLSLTANDNSYMYYSKVYDLREMGVRDKERLRIKIKKMSEGEILSPPITFESNTDKLNDNSTFELRRLASVMRKNHL